MSLVERQLFKRGSAARIVPRVVISATVLALLLAFLPFAELREALSRLPLGVWAAIALSFVAGHRLAVVKWRLLLAAGGAPMTSTAAIRCYGAGLFANLCLPSIIGGDVLRMMLAARETRRPEVVVLSSASDRAIDMLAVGALMLAGSLTMGLRSTGETPLGLRVGVPAWVLLAVLAALLVTHLRLDRWPRRIRRVVGRGLVALRRLWRQPRAAAYALSIALAVQGGFVLLNAWIGFALGLDVHLAVWFVVWPLAKLAGLLPVSLGGLGVRDATLGGLLLGFGVPLASGVAVSLVWQSVLIAGGLVGGVAWRVLRAPDEVSP